MDVYRIPVDAHPLIQAVHALASRSWQLDARDVRGDLQADLAAGPPTDGRLQPEDIARDVHRVQGGFEALLSLVNHGAGGFSPACSLHHPAGGGLGWHTNSNHPGWRIYVPFLHAVDEHGSTGLMTEDGLVTSDEIGYANLFQLGEDSWHAVTASVPRTCFGIKVPSDFAADLIRRFGPPPIIEGNFNDAGPAMTFTSKPADLEGDGGQWVDLPIDPV